MWGGIIAFKHKKCGNDLEHLHNEFFICHFCNLIELLPIAQKWEGDLKSYNTKSVLVRNINSPQYKFIIPEKLSNEIDNIPDYEKIMMEGF